MIASYGSQVLLSLLIMLAPQARTLQCFNIYDSHAAMIVFIQGRNLVTPVPKGESLYWAAHLSVATQLICGRRSREAAEPPKCCRRCACGPRKCRRLKKDEDCRERCARNVEAEKGQGPPKVEACCRAHSCVSMAEKPPHNSPARLSDASDAQRPLVRFC